jgi:hypothetical protein
MATEGDIKTSIPIRLPKDAVPPSGGSSFMHYNTILHVNQPPCLENN